MGMIGDYHLTERAPLSTHQLLLKASVDLSGLTDLITSQDGIGSIIQVMWWWVGVKDTGV